MMDLSVNNLGGSMKKKVLRILIVGVLVVCLTGCGASNKDKMLKILENEKFNCTEISSEETTCTKEDNNKKKMFKLSDSSIDYEETIYDAGTTRLVIYIGDINYIDNGSHSKGKVKAYFKGEDLIEFYPENCEDTDKCFLHVDERVYPELKKDYDRYKEYFNSDSYHEYLRLKNKRNKTLQEEYALFSKEITFEINSEIKDKDQFTENVNDALRYFEKTLNEAEITLGE